MANVSTHVPRGIIDREIGDVWFSPLGVYKNIFRLTKKVGPEIIEKNGKLKPVREARITAITALAMFMLRDDNPAYVQLSNREDSPFDSYICQRSTKNRGELLISNIQVTSYREGAKESLLSQLIRTKTPPNFKKYPDKCVLVIDLLVNEKIDEREQEKITKYLNISKTPFPVWTFRMTSLSPDTIGEMIIFNPIRRVFPSINFGRAAYKYQKLGLPDAIRVKWVLDKDKLEEDERFGAYNLPPWNPGIEEL